MVYLAKNGQAEIGTASIYTVGRFDGLALVVDQYAGSVHLPNPNCKSKQLANTIHRAAS
jgi:hypothetical protein